MKCVQAMRRTGVVLCLGIASSLCFAAETSPPGRKVPLTTLQKTHTKHWEAYSEKLQKLVDFAQEKNLLDAVATIEKYRVPPNPVAIRAVTLPTQLEPKLAADVVGDERHWQTQLRTHRQEYAQQLYLLSRQALYAGHPGFAYDLVREVVVHDPDHAPARRLLGYVQYGQDWVTQYAKQMLTKGQVWHEEFGWLPKSHLAKYSEGQRNVDGVWMSADKEAEIRRDFRRAWVVRTDHYEIRTNYSLERGVELGRALEDFHDFFHQMFAGFFNTPEQLGKIFDGAKSAQRVTPFKVHYYRDRDEYLQKLQSQFPQIGVTNGIYLTGDRTAHFYHDDAGGNEATLFHEATHQLFFESHLQERPIGEKAHFWVIEGIACYMESFRRDNGEFSVGDPRYIRFAGARMNHIDQNYYIPLKEFSGWSMREFQAGSMIAKKYTQAAGLAHFFMQYDGGRYRDALVAHLAQLYSSSTRKRDNADGLDLLTGVDFEELDQQYAEFLRECQQQVNTMRDGAEILR